MLSDTDAMTLILNNLDFEGKNNSTHPDFQTEDLAPVSDDYHEGRTSTTSMLAQAEGRHLNLDLPRALLKFEDPKGKNRECPLTEFWITAPVSSVLMKDTNENGESPE